MKIGRFPTLFVVCIHVMLINSAGLQLKTSVDHCFPGDIEEKQAKVNDMLKSIKMNCIELQKRRLTELLQQAKDKAASLTSIDLICLAEVALRVDIALRKLEDALHRNCDTGVRGESLIDNKFRRILEELNACVKFSNGCTECEQICCLEKRYQFYRNIDADIVALIEAYINCIIRYCDIINVDIDVIKNIIRDCGNSTTTTTEVTSTTTVKSTPENTDTTQVTNTPENTDTTQVTSTPENTDTTQVTSTPENTDTTQVTSTPENTETTGIPSTVGIINAIDEISTMH